MRMARQVFEHHPVIGYRFIPGLKARIPHEAAGYLIRTNNLGFRCDHDVTAARPSSMKRVLLFGDSFTAGDLVSNGSRYGDLLERAVPGVQVLNFGLPGTGTDQHYLAWREDGAGLEHDLLVISILVENIRRVAARARILENERGEPVVYAKPYYELVDGELALRNVPAPKTGLREDELDEETRGAVDRGGRFERLRGLVNQLGLRDLAQKVTRYQPLPEYDRADSPPWVLMRAILEHWIAEHRGRVLLMPIPLYQYIEETASPAEYRARFGEVAAATGCFLHDPLDDLLRYSPGERRAFRFERDLHPTAAGHAALAASLAPVVESLLETSRSRRSGRDERERFSASRRSITTRRRRSSATARSSPRPRRSASPQEARSALSAYTRSTTAWRKRSSRPTTSTRSSSTTIRC